MIFLCGCGTVSREGRAVRTLLALTVHSRKLPSARNSTEPVETPPKAGADRYPVGGAMTSSRVGWPEGGAGWRPAITPNTAPTLWFLGLVLSTKRFFKKQQPEPFAQPAKLVSLRASNRKATQALFEQQAAWHEGRSGFGPAVRSLPGISRFGSDLERSHEEELVRDDSFFFCHR